MSAYQYLVDATCMFNNMAGNNKRLEKKDLENQLALIYEEFLETHDGLRNDEPEAILDGAIDMLVVVTGFIEALRHRGYNVDRAMRKTADNNTTKFPVATTEADDNAALARCPQGARAEFNFMYNSYVFLNENNKVVKPIGYVKNDLKDCLP